jgi:hypothetical protein
LVEIRGRDESNDAIAADGGGSAWERMLDTLCEEDGRGTEDLGPGSLRASIAERLHTRGGSPLNDERARDALVRPVRRRRRGP